MTTRRQWALSPPPTVPADPLAPVGPSVRRQWALSPPPTAAAEPLAPVGPSVRRQWALSPPPTAAAEPPPPTPPPPPTAAGDYWIANHHVAPLDASAVLTTVLADGVSGDQTSFVESDANPLGSAEQVTLFRVWDVAREVGVVTVRALVGEGALDVRVDTWDGAAWIESAGTTLVDPATRAAPDWSVITRRFTASVTTTRLRISVRSTTTIGGGAGPVLRVGDLRAEPPAIHLDYWRANSYAAAFTSALLTTVLADGVSGDQATFVESDVNALGTMEGITLFRVWDTAREVRSATVRALMGEGEGGWSVRVDTWDGAAWILVSGGAPIGPQASGAPAWADIVRTFTPVTTTRLRVSVRSTTSTGGGEGPVLRVGDLRTTPADLPPPLPAAGDYWRANSYAAAFTSALLTTVLADGVSGDQTSFVESDVNALGLAEHATLFRVWDTAREVRSATVRALVGEGALLARVDTWDGTAWVERAGTTLVDPATRAAPDWATITRTFSTAVTTRMIRVSVRSTTTIGGGAGPVLRVGDLRTAP